MLRHPGVITRALAVARLISLTGLTGAAANGLLSYTGGRLPFIGNDLTIHLRMASYSLMDTIDRVFAFLVNHRQCHHRLRSRRRSRRRAWRGVRYLWRSVRGIVGGNVR
jgi:hypothetical protein